MNNQAFRSCCLGMAALAIAWTAPQARGEENVLSAVQIAIQLAPTKGLRPVDASAVGLPSVIGLGNRPSVDLPSEEGANSFKVVATEWFETKMKDKAQGYQDRTWRGTTRLRRRGIPNCGAEASRCP